MSDPKETPSPSLLSTILAGAFGNIMEWYDFSIYGFFAPVFGRLFFPAAESWAQLLAVFGVFAIGYLMRPLGSVLFGYVGDRFGRKKMLLTSVMLMALPSALMGLLPTYVDVGVLATVLLVLLRLLQGLSVGGEFTGSSVFLVEHAPPGRRGVVGSMITVGGGLGFLLASAVGTVITRSLSEESLYAWGWRLPYAVGLVTAAIAVYLRLRTVETPLFTELAARREVAESPLRELWRQHRREALTMLGLSWTQAVGFYVPAVYLTSWMAGNEGVPLATALTITTVSMAVTIPIIVLGGGYGSDRLGRKAVLLIVTLGTLLLPYPLFRLMNQEAAAHAWWPFLAGQGILMVLTSLYNGALPASLVEMVPTRARATVFSVSYSLAAGVFGGTTPLVCTWLVKELNDPLAPAYYLIGVGLLGTLVLLLRVRETHARPLP